MEIHSADRLQLNLSRKSERGNKNFVSYRQYSSEQLPNLKLSDSFTGKPGVAKEPTGKVQWELANNIKSLNYTKHLLMSSLTTSCLSLTVSLYGSGCFHMTLNEKNFQCINSPQIGSLEARAQALVMGSLFFFFLGYLSYMVNFICTENESHESHWEPVLKQQIQLSWFYHRSLQICLFSLRPQLLV